MTDWREAFPDDSRVTWERRLAAAAGAGTWALALPFVEAWRRDNSTELARSLEAYVASVDQIPLSPGLAPSGSLDEYDGLAIGGVIDAVRSVLRNAGVDHLILFRGQVAHPGAHAGEEVETVRRGLTAWTPERAIAIGHGEPPPAGCRAPMRGRRRAGGARV